MGNPGDKPLENHDITAPERKSDHIKLAFESRVLSYQRDTRFDYEPLLSGHPLKKQRISLDFLNHTFEAPIWVSSMTGGTSHAANINANLARMVGEYKLGMGLGSCRQLLYDDTYLADFAVRKLVNDQPVYANLGIAQLESMVLEKRYDKIVDLINKLEANGLIIHINPLQEWLQPEGDRYEISPIITIKHLCDNLDIPLIVKEVGQGMGPRSLRSLMQLPLAAIEFSALGGTNFAALELMRGSKEMIDAYSLLPKIGHTASEMVDFVNAAIEDLGSDILCRQFIISGGVNDFLDGYYLKSKLMLPSIYGHASTFLKYAMGDYETLSKFAQSQIEGYTLATALLKIVR